MARDIEPILRKWRNDDWTEAADLDAATFVSPRAIVVIGGCARSGTTLLRVMLDTHTQITIGPPTNLFVPTPIVLDELAFKYDLSLAEVHDLNRTATDRAHFIELFAALCTAQTQKLRWGDKTARNLLRFAWVHRHFPNAVTINVIRDGRDVVCSLRTHRKREVVGGQIRLTGNLLPLDACIDRWLLSMEIAAQYRGMPGYIEVRYEDLALRPAEALMQVCEAIDVAFEPGMLRFHKVRTNLRDPLKFPQNVEATMPLFTTSVGRWRNDLSAAEQTYVHTRLEATLAQLGYSA